MLHDFVKATQEYKDTADVDGQNELLNRLGPPVSDTVDLHNLTFGQMITWTKSYSCNFVVQIFL